MKKIIITDKLSQGKDEAWCEWFECPECKTTNIMRGCNYCQECGAKIIWKVKKYEE